MTVDGCSRPRQQSKASNSNGGGNGDDDSDDYDNGNEGHGRGSGNGGGSQLGSRGGSLVEAQLWQQWQRIGKCGNSLSNPQLDSSFGLLAGIKH